MTLPSLDEIKERKLVQWGLAYLGGAWLVLQVVAVLGATYGWPRGLLRAVPVVLAVGFLVALVVAWYHGEKGAQKVSGPELAILAGLLGVAGLGVMLVGGGADATAGADGAETELVGLPGPEVEQTAIAVLPFESIGGDGAFAAGLTDELLATLARVPSLRVSARTSAGVFQNVALSSDSLGRALGVAHLVEGTVRESEGRLRVTARLVNAASGLQEWSETYTRDVADIFAVQEEIARAVAVQLRVEVGMAALVGRAAPDPEVFALVVRARQLLERGGDDMEATWQEARRLLEEAVERDGAYAPARAGLAYARYVQAKVNADPEAREEAIAEAERALALNPNELLGHMVLAINIVENGGDVEAARGHMEQAVAANPADATALFGLAVSLSVLGDWEGSLRTARRATALDPLSPGAWRMAALLHSGAGQHEQAIEMGRTMLRLVPDQPLAGADLAWALAAAGETEEAIERAQRAVDFDSRDQDARRILAFAHAKAGNRAEAERLIESVHAQRAMEDAHAQRAIVEAALGDPDAAFAALERSITEGEPSISEIPVLPFFLTLRDDPRWDPLVARIRAGWERN